MKLSKHAIVKLLTQGAYIDPALVVKGLPPKSEIVGVSLGNTNEEIVELIIKCPTVAEDKIITIEFERITHIVHTVDKEVPKIKEIEEPIEEIKEEELEQENIDSSIEEDI